MGHTYTTKDPYTAKAHVPKLSLLWMCVTESWLNSFSFLGIYGKKKWHSFLNQGRQELLKAFSIITALTHTHTQKHQKTYRHGNKVTKRCPLEFGTSRAKKKQEERMTSCFASKNFSASCWAYSQPLGCVQLDLTQTPDSTSKCGDFRLHSLIN